MLQSHTNSVIYMVVICSCFSWRRGSKGGADNELVGQPERLEEGDGSGAWTWWDHSQNQALGWFIPFMVCEMWLFFPLVLGCRCCISWFQFSYTVGNPWLIIGPGTSLFFISFSSYVVCSFKKFYLHNTCGVSEIICARWHANFSWMPACQLLRWFIAHLIELVLVIGNVFMTT